MVDDPGKIHGTNPSDPESEQDDELDPLLEDAYLTLTNAFDPWDVFGKKQPDDSVDNFQRKVETEYLRLKKICDPRRYEFQEDINAAEEAQLCLEELIQRARREIGAGTYGAGESRVNRDFDRSMFIKVGERTFYYEKTSICEGTDTVVYPCYELREDESVRYFVIKVARGIEQNRAIEREAYVLRRIRDYKKIPQRRHFPSVQAEVKLSNGKLALIERRFAGITLEEVMQDPLHQGRVDQKNAMWMLGKGLSALGLAHACGVIHGGLTPQHLMYRTDHGMLICGWGGSVYDPSEQREKINRDFGKFAAPEIKTRRLPGPWTDLYELGLCMIWALGGDPETKEIPEDVDEPFQRLLQKLVIEDEHDRPFSAFQFFEQERQPVIAELQFKFGWPKGFYPFQLTEF